MKKSTEFTKGMSNFGKTISTLVNSLLLTIVYLLGVGVTSLIAKLSGKKFLEKKLEGETYWSDLNLDKKEKEYYYRQF